MTWYRALDRQTIQFDFVVNERAATYAHEREIEERGGRVFRLPRYRLLNHRKYAKEWSVLLKAHPEWRVIHAHHTAPAAIYLRIAKSLDRYTIAHSHTAGTDGSIRGLLKIISRWPLRYTADSTLACSRDAAKWMFGVRSDSTYILPNAIDTSLFSFDDNRRIRIRDEFGLQNAFVVGQVGRFESVKNHRFTLELMRSLRALCSESILLLVGDGSLRSETERLAKELGISEAVRFVGSRSDVPALLDAMDVLVLPSLYEGLPVSVLEGQASGLPCYVADTVSREVAVSDLCTFLALKAGPEEWAHQIVSRPGPIDRRSASAVLEACGLDVADQVRSLEQLYLRGHERASHSKGLDHNSVFEAS